MGFRGVEGLQHLRDWWGLLGLGFEEFRES